MTRGLTTEQQTVANARNGMVVPLVAVEFDSGTLRLCLGGMNVVDTTGTTWYAAQSLSLETTSESADSTDGLSFSLNGLDAAIIAIAAGEPYFRRPVLLYEQYLDANFAPVQTPKLEWAGRLTALTIEEQGRQVSVAGSAEHWSAEEKRVRVRYYNHAGQARAYPSDTGFDKVEQMAEVQLVWPAKEALQK